MWKNLVGLLLALCLGCGGAPAPTDVPPPILGPDGAPARIVNLQLQGVDDSRFRLSAHRGEAVAVLYLTTWSIPAGVAVQRLKPLVRGPDAVSNLRVVGVALDPHPEAMLPPFTAHAQPGFPVFPGSAADRAGQTPFGELPGVPTMFLIDPMGRHVETVVGMFETAQVRRWAQDVLKGSR